MSKTAIHHVQSNSPCCFEGVYTWTLSCNPTHENANSDNALHLHNLNSDLNCNSNISYSHIVWSNALTWLSLLIYIHILKYLTDEHSPWLDDLKYIPLNSLCCYEGENNHWSFLLSKNAKVLLFSQFLDSYEDLNHCQLFIHTWMCILNFVSLTCCT